MPEFKNILVEVLVKGVDENGKKTRRPLEEWGVQKMRKSKNISAYIEAETGKSFRILIRPKIPFPLKGAPAAHEHNTRQNTKAQDNMTSQSSLKMDHDEDGSHDSSNKPDQHGMSNSNGGANPNHPSSNSDASVRIKEEPIDEPMTPFSQAPSTEKMMKRTSPPPFHLMASVFLDGRKKAERKVFLFLDPDVDEFNDPDREVEIKSRWVQDKDGTIREKTWVFQDIGIESLFDKMLITEGNNIVPIDQGDEAALVDACESLQLNRNNDFAREENSKAGQILVTIDRVTLGERLRETKYQAKHKEHETEDVDMMYAGKEITHTAGFALKKSSPLKPEGVTAVYYHSYKDEGHFATFQFFYRSKSILQKFNFTSLPKVVPYVLPSKRLNMAFETPLSISSSTIKACSTIEKGKIAASDIGKQRIKGKGLFSRTGIYGELRRRARQSRKKTESDFWGDDQSKSESLSSASLVLTEHSSNIALPVSFPNMSDTRRDNLRSFPITNKLSLIASSHCVPFGQTGPKAPICGASRDPLGSTSTVPEKPSLKIDHGYLESIAKAESRSASTTCNLSSLGSTLRDKSNHLCDTNDESEAYHAEVCLKSDTDQAVSEICKSNDDQGLSTRMTKLALGKRGRESEDCDFGLVEMKAKKMALGKTRLRPVRKA
ncbi:hypothetical protein MMC26_005458 [Xylographa opegraphella]|nr:hypothetical protein [Xylographa opegraphella]